MGLYGYVIGDKVVIRKDLEDNTIYGINGTVTSMLAYRGQEATITDLLPHGYEIDIDGGEWGWTNEMFEGISKGIKGE